MSSSHFFKELFRGCRKKASLFTLAVILLLSTKCVLAQDYQFTAYDMSIAGYGDPYLGDPYTLDLHVANIPSPVFSTDDGSNVPNLAIYDLSKSLENYATITIQGQTFDVSQNAGQFELAVYQADASSGASLIASGVNVIVSASPTYYNFQTSLYGDPSLFSLSSFPSILPPLASYTKGAGILLGSNYNQIVALRSTPIAAVPEASTTVSFGLLLALGLGGVVIAAKRRKAAAS